MATLKLLVPVAPTAAARVAPAPRPAAPRSVAFLDNGQPTYRALAPLLLAALGERPGVAVREYRKARYSSPAAPEVLDEIARAGGTDGLPIVPPTAERVRAMVAGARRDPAEVVAVLPPGHGAATVERVAVNAVMARLPAGVHARAARRRRGHGRARVQPQRRAGHDQPRGAAARWSMARRGARSASTRATAASARAGGPTPARAGGHSLIMPELRQHRAGDAPRPGVVGPRPGPIG